MSLIEQVKKDLGQLQIEKADGETYIRRGNLFFSSPKCADTYVKSTINILDSVHAKDPQLAEEVAQQVRALYKSPIPIIAALVDAQDQTNQCGEILEQVRGAVQKVSQVEQPPLEKIWGISQRGITKNTASKGGGITQKIKLPPHGMIFFCWDERFQSTCLPKAPGGATKTHEENHALHYIQDTEAAVTRYNTPVANFHNLEEKITHEFSNRIREILGFEPVTNDLCQESHPSWKLPAGVYPLAQRPNGFSSPLSGSVPNNLVEYAMSHSQSSQQTSPGQTALLTLAGIGIAKLALNFYNKMQTRREPLPETHRSEETYIQSRTASTDEWSRNQTSNFKVVK